MGGRGTEAGMLVAAARGEHWALEQLFTRYWRALVSYYRAVGWGDVAEDLAMNVWSSLLGSGLRRFRGESESEFRMLLFTIAHRRLVDHRRRRQRRPAVLRAAEEMERPVASGQGGDPAVMLEEHEDAAALIAYLRQVLSPAQAEVVHLRVVAGFTATEVATIVKRSPNAVSMLYGRALRRLGNALSAEEAGDS